MNVLYYILFVVLTIYIISFKTIEGFDDEFYDYKTLPNSYIYNSNKSKHNDMFYFYKGKGTYKKEKIKRDIKEDKKISTLNNLLDRLLGKILSDEQNCVGSFGKYSECDKQCGLGGNQTRKYTITQERGNNGEACPHEDGYEEKIPCFIDECQLGDLCENDRDCDTRNCEKNSKRCGERIECDKDNLNRCNQDQCRQLNEEYGTEENLFGGKYLYELNIGSCFFKTPAEIEEMTVNLYTYNFENKGEGVNVSEDCAYYQEIRNNECVNKRNIILKAVDEDLNQEPVCEPGRSPQPNLFNIDYACEICDGENFNGDNENCECDVGFYLVDDECQTLTRSAIRAVKSCDLTRGNFDELDESIKKSIFNILSSDEESSIKSTQCLLSDTDISSFQFCPPGTYFNWNSSDEQAICLACPIGTTINRDNYSLSENEINSFINKSDYNESCNVLLNDPPPMPPSEAIRISSECQNGNYDDGICNCFDGFELNDGNCIPCGIGRYYNLVQGGCSECLGETYNNISNEPVFSCSQCGEHELANEAKNGCVDKQTCGGGQDNGLQCLEGWVLRGGVNYCNGIQCDESDFPSDRQTAIQSSGSCCIRQKNCRDYDNSDIAVPYPCENTDRELINDSRDCSQGQDGECTENICCQKPCSELGETGEDGEGIDRVRGTNTQWQDNFGPGLISNRAPNWMTSLEGYLRPLSNIVSSWVYPTSFGIDASMNRWRESGCPTDRCRWVEVVDPQPRRNPFSVNKPIYGNCCGGTVNELEGGEFESCGGGEIPDGRTTYRIYDQNRTEHTVWGR